MPEKEYIEREALIKTCEEIIQIRWNETTAPVSWSHAYADFIDDIENQPAADVEPVRHGRWIDNKHTDTAICSECKGVFTDETNYCPKCGARMNKTE